MIYRKIGKSKSKDLFSSLLFSEIGKKFLCQLGVKKATGGDGISARIVKLAEPAILKPLTLLLNKSIESSVFPDNMKFAQVVPLHKIHLRSTSF